MLLADSEKKKRADWRFYARETLNQRITLLQKALAPWPRRSAPLLEINCGDGSFLPMLWHAGFDAMATEKDYGLREKALAQPVPALEIYAASADDLPFDNDNFDWVILHLPDGTNLGACIEEALRVARRGIMLTFWNRNSLPGLIWRMGRKRKAWDAPSWWEVWRLVNAFSMRMQAFAAFWLPTMFWTGKLSALNGKICWTPLGAWCVARLDLGPLRPFTPSPLSIGKLSPEPAFEYMHLATKNNRKA